MKLTKFGVSVAFISAVGYFAGYAGVIPITLLFIFALYADVDVTVKKNVSQALILSIFLSIVVTVFSACSSSYIDCIDWLFNGSVGFLTNYTLYDVFCKLNIFSVITTICNWAEFIIMIYAFISALKSKVVTIPCITKFVAKHFDAVEEETATE